MSQLTLKGKKDLTKDEIYDIIINYIHEKLDLSRRESLKDDNFQKPAWSEYQAYQLGLQKAYQKMLDFIPTPDQGEK